MPMPAARVTDLHACALTLGIPAGPILPPCAVTVLTCSLPQARAFMDQVACVAGPIPIVLGSPTVLVNNMPAVRIVMNATGCGGVVMAPGALTPPVLIGP
ncbi:MAG: PAAR domain-containing protein [Alphaproteobacteria bacterium]|nr:PAAR domain-containing protein [Alphaproteobacteria bacterium]MCW5743747.1 PAAR domain-containing protein [Alphaproteobacteria bacterium]